MVRAFYASFYSSFTFMFLQTKPKKKRFASPNTTNTISTLKIYINHETIKEKAFFFLFSHPRRKWKEWREGFICINFHCNIAELLMPLAMLFAKLYEFCWSSSSSKANEHHSPPQAAAAVVVVVIASYVGATCFCTPWVSLSWLELRTTRARVFLLCAAESKHS